MPRLTPLERVHHAIEMIDRPASFEEIAGTVPFRVDQPDKVWLVESGSVDLFLVPTEGGDPIPLTRDESLDTDPHWGPDSRSVVFSSDRSGTMDLWIKDVEAPPREGERRLTTSLGAELSPAWSPDGKSIAYLDHDSRLHVVGIDGDDRRRPCLEDEAGEPSVVRAQVEHQAGRLSRPDCEPRPDR